MRTTKNPKAIAVVSTVLCIASLLWLMSTQRVNNTLEERLGTERLKSEALLSEKLLLQKDLDKMQGQLSNLKGINKELDEIVKNTELKLATQQQDVKRLRRQNSSLAGIQKQRDELLRLQTELERELSALKISLADLESQNGVLSHTIAELQDQNRRLTEDLSRVMYASIDHSQVQAVKGKKQRLTVKARRTNKLIADFEVPASLRNISFRVLDPGGNPLTDRQGSIVSKLMESDRGVMASAEETEPRNLMHKVQMEYIPKVRLQPGVYRVEILNDNLYVGSLNVKLR